MDENDRERADESGAEGAVDESVTTETVHVRRAPRYLRFIIVGVVVCVILAFILTYSFPQGAGYDRNAVFGYMALVAIAVGVGLGSVAAIIADRVTARTRRAVQAHRIDVDVSPTEGGHYEQERELDSDAHPTPGSAPAPDSTATPADRPADPA